MSFIHFGCWNSGYCNKEIVDNPINGLSNVMININIPKIY